MAQDNKAYFVDFPRKADELKTLHLLDLEHPFRIVGQIRLDGIDFENLATDMLVEREYLEPYEEVCHLGDVYECVFVYRRGKPREGFLIVPDSGGFIKCAAYYRKKRDF